MGENITLIGTVCFLQLIKCQCSVATEANQMEHLLSSRMTSKLKLELEFIDQIETNIRFKIIYIISI